MSFFNKSIFNSRGYTSFTTSSLYLVNGLSWSSGGEFLNVSSLLAKNSCCINKLYFYYQFQQIKELIEQIRK